MQGIEPGSRLLVAYDEDPGFLHERLALWPVSEGRWVFGVPGPDRLYEQSFDDFVYVGDVTGEKELPVGARRYEVVSFDRPLSNEALDTLIREGQREAERERKRLELDAPAWRPLCRWWRQSACCRHTPRSRCQ